MEDRFLAECLIFDQKVLLNVFISRTSAPNYKKNMALKLCVTVAVWLWNGV